MSSNIAEIKDLTSSNELTLVKSDTAKKGVLCTLEGPFGSSIEPTRNNRAYIDELWDKILNSDEVAEMFDTKTFFGEADHPLAYQDRLETTTNQISHCITSVQKLPSGIIYGTLDVLDTPNGRIIKTLVDYGSKLGISTRGAGQVIDHPEYGKIVDPATYTFITWDIVVMPGAKVARLSKVEDINESKQTQNPTTTMKDELITQVNEALSKKDIKALETMQVLLEAVNDSELNTLRETVNTVVADSKDTISAEASTELLEAYGKISELDKRLTQSTKMHKSRKEKYDNLLEKYRKLSDNKSSLEDTISDKDKKLLEYSSLVDESYKQLNQANDSMAKLKQNHLLETNKLKSKVNELTSMLETSNEINEENSSEIESLNEMLETESEERVRLQESVENLTSNYNVLLNEYVALKCNSLGVNPNLVESFALGTDIEAINESIRETLVKQSKRKLTDSVSNMILEGNEVKCKYPKKSNEEDAKYVSGIVEVVSRVRGV